jgi:hypothetical protein
VGGHGLARPEAHVQRGVRLKAEAALLVAELVRGDAEVEQHSVHRDELRPGADGGQIAEVGVDEEGRAFERLEACARDLQGGFVGVNAKE